MGGFGLADVGYPAPVSAIATATTAAPIAALRRVMLASLGARLLTAIRPSTTFGLAGWQTHRRPGVAGCDVQIRRRVRAARFSPE
jgi:hypothetical protein